MKQHFSNIVFSRSPCTDTPGYTRSNCRNLFTERKDTLVQTPACVPEIKEIRCWAVWSLRRLRAGSGARTQARGESDGHITRLGMALSVRPARGGQHAGSDSVIRFFFSHPVLSRFQIYDIPISCRSLQAFFDRICCRNLAPHH